MDLGNFMLYAIVFSGTAYLTSRVVKNFNRPTTAYNNNPDVVFDEYNKLTQHERLYTKKDIQNTLLLLSIIFGWK